MTRRYEGVARSREERYGHVGFFSSASTPDKTYEVKWDNDELRLTCNCPAWIFKKKGLRRCKHTLAAAAGSTAGLLAPLPKVVQLAAVGEETPRILRVERECLTRTRRMIVLDD